MSSRYYELINDLSNLSTDELLEYTVQKHNIPVIKTILEYKEDKKAKRKSLCLTLRKIINKK